MFPQPSIQILIYWKVSLNAIEPRTKKILKPNKNNIIHGNLAIVYS